MVGITTLEIYVPVHRLSRDDVGKFWGIKGPTGEKTVAGYDEDSVTMEVAAVLSGMEQKKKAVDGYSLRRLRRPIGKSSPLQ